MAAVWMALWAFTVINVNIALWVLNLWLPARNLGTVPSGFSLWPRIFLANAVIGMIGLAQIIQDLGVVE